MSINLLTEESANRVISIHSPIIHLHLHLHLFQYIVSPQSNPSSLFVYTSYLDSIEKGEKKQIHYFASSDWSLTTRQSIDRISMRNKTVTNSRSMGLWIFSPLLYSARRIVETLSCKPDLKLRRAVRVYAKVGARNESVRFFSVFPCELIVLSKKERVREREEKENVGSIQKFCHIKLFS